MVPDDALNVGLHRRTGQRAARLGLHFSGELLVLRAVAAFEDDAIDDRIFDHRDDDAAARLADIYILKQAGGDKRLQAIVQRGGVDAPTRPGLK